MTIWEHLEELRRRIIKAAIGVLGSTIVAWNFRERLLAELVKPYQRTWLEHFHKPLVLQTLAPADAFLGYLELSLTAGVVASAPIIFYQLWAFISPGLYRKEKRLIVPFVLFSTMLFLSGVAFAYYVAFPFTFNYFMSLLGPVSEGVELTQIVTLEFFLDFATRFLLAFGAVFELPLFIAFLVLAKIVTPKQLLKFGRWATVLAFIVGAIVTPGPRGDEPDRGEPGARRALLPLDPDRVPALAALQDTGTSEGGRLGRTDAIGTTQDSRTDGTRFARNRAPLRAEGQARVMVEPLPFGSADPRVRRLNDRPVATRGDFVVYWMQAFRRGRRQRGARVRHRARERARRPVPRLRGAPVRLPARERSPPSLRARGRARHGHAARASAASRTSFFLPRTPDEARGVVAKLAARARLVVSDDFPSFVVRGAQRGGWPQWAPCAFFVVDDCAVVPMALLAGPEIGGAHASGPGSQRALDAWLRPLDRARAPACSPSQRLDLPFPPVDIAKAGARALGALVAACAIDHGVPPVEETPGGIARGRATARGVRSGPAGDVRRRPQRSFARRRRAASLPICTSAW